MINYEKPIVLANSELSEGVYAGSGTTTYECFTANYSIVTMNNDRTYAINIGAKHYGTHHSTAQTMRISFNEPVTVDDISGGSVISGNKTNTLILQFNEHFTFENEKPFFCRLWVSSTIGLVIKECIITCNKECGEHVNPTW